MGVAPQITYGDTFKLNGHKANVIYHQGLLEHFEVNDVYKILAQQLGVSGRVVFSVPSVFYPTRDFGNENLQSLDWWQKVVGRQFEIEHSEYYGGAHDRYHVLMDLTSTPEVRGTTVRRR